MGPQCSKINVHDQSISAFSAISVFASVSVFTPEAILLIGCQAVLGCGCVVKLLSVNTAPRAHDWASSILIHTHTNLIGSKACQGLVVGGRKHPSTCYPSPQPPTHPLPGLFGSDRHVYIAPSVSQVTQSGVQLPPSPSNHCLSLSPTPSPRVKAPGCQTLIARSNNICTFNTMAVLKSSLCLKCSEPGGSLKPERPSGNALGHLIQVTLAYFLFIVFISSFSPLSISTCRLHVRKGQPG